LKPSARLASAACLVVSALAASRAPAQNLPPDFVAEPVGGSWNLPTCVSFAGTDDLLVAEKAGELWDVRRGIRHSKPVFKHIDFQFIAEKNMQVVRQLIRLNSNERRLNPIHRPEEIIEGEMAQILGKSFLEPGEKEFPEPSTFANDVFPKP
jgi:hypothetical protein